MSPDLKVLQQKVRDHMKNNERRFNSIESDINSIMSNIAGIKDNHLAHIQDDMGDLKVEVQGLKGDVKWIKIIGGAVFIETAGVLIKLIFG